MKLLKWLGVFLFVLVSCQSDISSDLVQKYLISMRNVKSVVMMLCRERDFQILGKQLNNENIYITNYFIGRENKSLTSFLPRFFYASCGIVVDCGCPGVDEVLQNASANRYFNLTYSWLLIGADGDSWEDFLDPVFNIEFSSDVVYVQTGQENSSKVDLVDVYSLGRHRGSNLIGVKFAEYDVEEKNLEILVDLWPKFSRTNRADFKGFQLKAVVPIDRDNVTEADVNPLLKLPGKTPGIASLVKYQSNINFYLQEMYNYSVKYRVVRAWGGHLPSGYRLGLLGVVARGEADISMSPVHIYLNRFDEYDLIHRGYYKAGFVFCVGSDSSASDASLLAPFKPDVWFSLIITIVIVLIVGLIVRVIFLINKLPTSGSSARDLVDIFAALCQQGVDPVPSNMVQKIIIFMTLFLAFFLYNYYTSSVVGVLLSTPVKGPTTPEEILVSNYKVSFDDVGYHKILFREKRYPIVQKIYEKKMIGLKRTPNDLPMYADITSAVPFLKTGEWAFHCELTEAYDAIARSFDASEICDLRVVPGLLNNSEHIEAILPKFSQYREMMRIGFMRLQEVGFVARAIRIYWKTKPECTSGISVFAVGFPAISAAIYVLLAGMAGSLLLLVCEIAWKRYTSCIISSSLDPFF